MAASIVAFRARDEFARHLCLHAAVHARQRQRVELEGIRIADELALDSPAKRAERVARVQRLVDLQERGPGPDAA